MRAKVISISAVFILVTIGIFSILRYGYKPAPVRVMKPSFFAQPEEIGATVYRRFFSPIEQHKVLVFGVPPAPDFHRQIVRGLLLAAVAEKLPFQAVVMEEQMPPLDLTGLPEMEKYTLRMNTPTQADWIDLMAKLKKEDKRVLVYSASVFTSHILTGNAVARYEEKTGERLFTISSLMLSLAAAQEHKVDPPCVGSERDANGGAPLGCAAMLVSRGLYRKEFPKDRFVAIMNSPKPEDYLLLVAPPRE